MPLGQRMGSMGRTATISRKTRETDIRVELCLDGSGTAEVGTGLPFFDHLLEALARHGCFDLQARAEGDLEVDQHDRRRCSVVPALGRRLLVVPDLLTRVRIECQDRRQVQVVATPRASQSPHPRRAVAGADVEQTEFGVVGHRIPGRATASELPVLAIPGGRGLFEGFRLEGLVRIPGNRVAPPDEAAVVRIKTELATEVILEGR